MVLCVFPAIGKAIGGECKTDDIVKPSFGEMFVASDKSIHNMNEGFQVDIKYKVGDFFFILAKSLNLNF